MASGAQASPPPGFAAQPMFAGARGAAVGTGAKGDHERSVYTPGGQFNSYVFKTKEYEDVEKHGLVHPAELPAN